MKLSVRPELPTPDLRSLHPTHAAVENSALFTNDLESTYKSGNVVQTNGATSVGCTPASSVMAARISAAI